MLNVGWFPSVTGKTYDRSTFKDRFRMASQRDSQSSKAFLVNHELRLKQYRQKSHWRTLLGFSRMCVCVCVCGGGGGGYSEQCLITLLSRVITKIKGLLE